MSSECDNFEAGQPTLSTHFAIAGHIDPSRLNRHRGLWSFLTRFFYLGQIYVAQQLMSATANASQTDEGLGNSRDGSSATDPAKAQAAAASLTSVSGGDEAGAPPLAGPPQASKAGGAFHGAPDQDALDRPEPGAGHGAEISVGGQAGGAAGGVYTIAVDGAAPAADQTLSVPSDGPGVHVPDGPDGSIPIIDIDVGGIGVGVDIGNDISIDVELGNLLDLDLDLPINIGAITAPVLTLVASVAPTLNLVDNVVSSVPVVGDFVGSSGVISFLSDKVTNIANPDTLFDAGKYTDLNIAMRSDVSDGGDVVHSATTTLTDMLLGDAHASDALDIGHSSDGSHGVLSALIHDTAKGGLSELFT